MKNNLATLIYKVKNGLSLEMKREDFLFQENKNYYFESGTQLAGRNLHTAPFVTDTIT